MQAFVDKQERYPGQDKTIVVRVSYDTASRTVIVDLGRGFIPKGMTKWREGFSDTYNRVSQYGHDLVDGIIDISTVSLRFDGSSINTLFPADFPIQTDRSDTSTLPTPPPVVLNPGSGYYFNHGSNQWVTQQSPSNGILEDDYTAKFSDYLQNQIYTKNTAVKSIKQTRNLRDFFIDPTSNVAGWRLASRYYMQKLYPDNGPTLWNIFPNGTDDTTRLDLREQDEDLASRPLYANLVNATHLISIHTNSGETGKTGAEVIVQSGSPFAQKLGNSVLCYLREQIHSVPGYENFKIAHSVTELDKLENRKATMPAIIIGLGYHTNTQDAAALKDQNFAQAALRGVEKGLRLRSVDCSPFTLVSIEQPTSAPSRDVYPKLTYSGDFDTWLHIDTTFISCPVGKCKAKHFQFARSPADKTVELEFACPSGIKQPTTFVAKTKIYDAFNVQGGELQHQYICTP